MAGADTLLATTTSELGTAVSGALARDDRGPDDAVGDFEAVFDVEDFEADFEGVDFVFDEGDFEAVFDGVDFGADLDFLYSACNFAHFSRKPIASFSALFCAIKDAIRLGWVVKDGASPGLRAGSGAGAAFETALFALSCR